MKIVFNQIDTDGDKMLTFDEVYNFLNSKAMETGGTPFDRKHCRELFSKLDRNQDQQVTIDEVIISYCEHKKEHERQILALRKEIDAEMV
jgi:Ca2+-binding EF-hand superfamily protein